MRPSVRPTTASSQSGMTWTRTITCSSQAQLVHQWRRSHRRLRGAHHALSSHIALTLAHLVMSSHTSLAQVLSLFTTISIPSMAHPPWKACATPPTRRVRTPTTSPSPSQGMSPTSWPSASSTTHRFPSPSWSRHRTKTWMTWHSASCSQRHTEDKPITANQKARQSVCRRCL